MAVRRLDLIITSNATAAMRGFVNLGGAAKGAERRFGRAGAVLGRVFAGAAIGAGIFAVQSVKAFIDFDDAMTKSLAIMGDISGPMRKKMENAAKKVGSTTTHSATDAAESYFYLASAGLNAKQSIKALPVVAKFAQAGNFDMARATDLLTDAQTALGMSYKDPIKNQKAMIRVGDVLVKANQMANASVEQFSEALTSKAATALRNRNKDLEEGVAVLAYFANRGIKGAKAGEFLNVVLRDLPRAVGANEEVFKKFGLNIVDNEGNLKNLADVAGEFERVLGPMSDAERAAAFDQLGLTRSVRDAIEAMMGGSDQIREYERELRNAGGAMDEVSKKQMESLKEKIDLIKDKINVLMITLGEPIAVWLADSFLPWVEEKLIPALGDIGTELKKLKPLFEGLGKALDNPAAVKTLTAIVGFAAGAKTLGMLGKFFEPVGKALAVVGGALGTLMARVPGAAKVMRVFTRVMDVLKHPILAIRLAFMRVAPAIGKFLGTIAGLVSRIPGLSVVFRVLTSPLSLLRLAFTGIVTVIKGAVIGALGALAAALGVPIAVAAAIVAAVVAVGVAIYIFRDEVWAALQAVGRFFGMLWSKIYNGFVLPIVNFFTGPFAEFWVGVWNRIRGPVQGFLRFLRVWAGIVVAVALAPFIALGTFVYAFWPVFVMIARAAWAAITAVIRVAWTVISAVVRVGLTILGAIIRVGWAVISTVFRVVWAAITAVVRVAWNVIGAVIRRGIAIARAVISVGWSVVSTVFRVAWNLIVAILRGAWNIIGGVIRTGARVARVVISTVWRIISTATRVAWNLIGAVIRFAWNNIIKPVWRAIRAFITNILIPVFGFLMRVARNIWNAISRVIRAAWNNVLKPVWNAIGAFIRNVLVPVFRFLMRGVRAVWDAIGRAIRWVWANIVRPVWAAVKRFIITVLLPVFRQLMRGIRAVWDRISSVIATAWRFIRDRIFKPIANFLRERLPPAFRAIRDVIKRIWESIRRTAVKVWDKITGAVRAAVNLAIRIINRLGDAIEGVADAIGVDITIGNIDEFRGPRRARRPTNTAARSHGMATGGMVPLPQTDPRRSGPFVTSGPRAIVGEGNPHHPEFVIPTDPKFRNRALGLFQSLGTQLLAPGGTTQPRGPGIAGLYNPLANKVANIIRQGRGRVSIISGWRDSAKQAMLYSRYLAGTGNLAARPGTSNHEGGAAVDFGGDRALYTRLARAAGLVAPVRGEPWHWEHPAQTGRDGGGGGGGGIGHFIDKIKNAVKEVKDLGDKLWGLPKKAINWLKDKAIGWVKDKAMDFLAGPAGAIVSSLSGKGFTNQKIGKEVAAARGWTGAKWDALNKLIDSESSWDNTAQNPTSTAYGIGQFLNSTWATVGARKTSDLGAQLQATYDYIEQRYGGPVAAWRFKKANNYYKAGGILPGFRDGLWRVPYDNFPASLHRDEMILPKEAADAHRDGTEHAPSKSFTIENINLSSSSDEDLVRQLERELAWRWKVAG